jgi:hypothetical protein
MTSDQETRIAASSAAPAGAQLVLTADLPAAGPGRAVAGELLARMRGELPMVAALGQRGGAADRGVAGQPPLAADPARLLR